MTSLAPSPTLVALVQAATTLPVFLIGLPGGAIADVVDRRRLLLVTQGWMLCAAAILGALTLLNAITPWSLLLLTFALGLGAAMNAPAWQAIIPELVHEGDLKSAVTLNGIGYNVARAVGPALGGAVVAAFGSAAVFLLNACSFLGVMLVLYRWRRPVSPSGLPAEDVSARCARECAMYATRRQCMPSCSELEHLSLGLARSGRCCRWWPATS